MFTRFIFRRQDGKVGLQAPDDKLQTTTTEQMLRIRVRIACNSLVKECRTPNTDVQTGLKFGLGKSWNKNEGGEFWIAREASGTCDKRVKLDEKKSNLVKFVTKTKYRWDYMK